MSVIENDLAKADQVTDNQDVIIPVGLKSNINDDVVDTVVTYFSLTPSSDKPWKTRLVRTPSQTEVSSEIGLSSLTYEFMPISGVNELQGVDVKQKVLEVYQRAVLIVDLPTASAEGEWHFDNPGAVFEKAPTPEQCSIEQTVSEDGKQLVFTIDKVVSITVFDLEFVYKASFTTTNGQTTGYTSQDPSISIGRRKDN
jgi:hypothetical protein